MRFLKITILAVFITSSAACFLFSGQIVPTKNNVPDDNLQEFFTQHAQTLQTDVAENIKGDFERNNIVESNNIKAEMTTNGVDFFVTLENLGQKQTYKIEAIVGKNQIQQYIARKEEKSVVLPVAYDLRQKRWFDLNEASFESNDADFKDWKTDCAACHLEKNVSLQSNFDIKELNSNASLLACGSCHAKGLHEAFPKLDEIVSTKIFSGDIISSHQKPSQTADGSVRFGAHEYQQILRSVCFVKSKSDGQEISGEKINCLSCHSIENGKIDVKTDEKILSFAACTSCHQQFDAPDSITEHTKHSAVSEASNCYNCHMPETIYGHLKFQRTHEISIPDPALTVKTNAPNACNLCHTDKSVNWAILQSKTLWSQYFSDAKISKDLQFNKPEGIRGLFADDNFTRALTADSLNKHATSNWFAPFALEAFQKEKDMPAKYFLENLWIRVKK